MPHTSIMAMEGVIWDVVYTPSPVQSGTGGHLKLPHILWPLALD